MGPSITRIILYVRDIPKCAEFYRRHFGMTPLPTTLTGWLELEGGVAQGCGIALHQAAKSQKSGAAMKIVFGVANVRAFVAERATEGLQFGAVHVADGYEFANAKDPAGNSISVSSRGMAKG